MKDLTLKQARVLADLTQAELSKEVGVSTQTLSLWELGKAIPNAKHFMKLCRICNVSPENIKL